MSSAPLLVFSGDKFQGIFGFFIMHREKIPPSLLRSSYATFTLSF